MWEAKIKKMNLFVRIITFGQARAITLAPFGIYIRERYFEWGTEYERERNSIMYRLWCELINHENTHWKQQLEMLIIFFYPWYFIEWVIKLIFPPVGAYKDISMEREANEHESDPTYNSNRKHYAWRKHILKVQVKK